MSAPPPILFPPRRKKRSGGKITSKRRVAVCDAGSVTMDMMETRYPMLVMTVATLLGLTELLPHQDMLREKLLIPYDPFTMAGRIIFVSHQWTGHKKADATGLQLRTLQRVLTRLMRGEISKVEMNWKQQIGAKRNMVVKAKQWKAALPHMFIWIDYSCIPQPTAGKLTENLIPQQGSVLHGSFLGSFRKSFRALPVDTENEEEIVSKPLNEDDEEEGETKGELAATSDHRQGGAETPAWMKHVQHWLGQAVDSIPAYIERSSLVLVLVPPCDHVDRAGELCDYMNWRRRGWCRLELAGAVLARTDVRLMTVMGASATPEFMFPADAIFLAPGHGTYTCCARNHLSNGGAVMPCDLESVGRVLSTMIDAKVEHLWNEGLVFDARVFAGLKHWFMRGLPSRSVAGDADGEGGLDAACMLFRWRGDEEEKAETRRTGAGLLFWSALGNNLEAVRALGREMGDSGRLRGDRLRVDRPDLFTIFQKGFTSLHAAGAIGSWAVVEALLDMGADPMARTNVRFDVLIASATFDRPDIITAWCRRFPEWDFTSKATGAGVTALGWAVVVGVISSETVGALVKAGGACLCVCTTETGCNILHNVAANPDSDTENVRYLLALPGVQKLVNTPMRPITFKWKAIYLLSRLLVRLGSKKAIFKAVSEWQLQTPLCGAARNGNTAVMKVLVGEGGADISLRNARGHTALDQARMLGGEDLSEDIVKLLGGD